VPSDDDAKRLQSIMDIRPQNSSSGSEGSYPSFFPHITLAALDPSTEIPLNTIISSVPQSQSSIQADFKSIDVGSHFFRSVYISIEPSDHLSALHAHIHTALNIEPRTPSFPHLSLCYITDDDAEAGERDKFYGELDRTGKILPRDGGVSLDCAAAGETDWMAGFRVPEIWITKCDGPVEEWSVLHKIPLA